MATTIPVLGECSGSLMEESELIYGVWVDDVQFLSSVKVNGFDDFKATVVVMNKDGSKENLEYDARVSSPEQAVEAIEWLMLTALNTMDKPESVAFKAKKKMEKAMKKKGYIKLDRPSNKDDELILRQTIQKLIPASLGGLDLGGIRQYEDPAPRELVCIAFWGEPEDEISLEIRVPQSFFHRSLMELERFVTSGIQEKIAKLRMEYPGDFEVLCIDATGEEYRFDENMTYLAESHSDPEMVWVYDRFGQRGEFGMFRFEKVETVKAKVSKVREEAREPVSQSQYTMPKGLSRVLEKMES